MSTVTPEESARRSELAKRLHAEPHPDDPNRRRFGGPQPNSGRAKKQRASARIADAAAQHADLIVKAYKRATESPDERVAVMAAEKWVAAERAEVQLQLDEDKHLESMSRGDLIAQLAEQFVKLQESGVAVVSSEIVIEATARDIEEPNPFFPDEYDGDFDAA